ncbi:MAG: hypothetical protein H3C50_08825 [Kiritimatiellae bacterium]|nr:hypothetical protein [Kiritimatiellia bacterium]MCO5069143.1 hypothetical protein [Kiritimatiellia bacterium]
MIKRMLIGPAASVLLLVGAMVAAHAQPVAEPSQKPSLETLRGELVSVRSEIDVASRSLAQQSKALATRQREIEYKDPEIVALRDELVALEKQVVEKRKQLQARVALNSDIKALERERKELFQHVQQLRDTEAAIQREITALEHAQE